MDTLNTIDPKENLVEPKKNNKVFIFIIVFLVIIIGFLVWQLFETKNQVKTIIVEKTNSIMKSNELQSELDSLTASHNKIKEENGELNEQLSAKDSIINKHIKEIQKLIAKQADYNSIKKKLEYLRSIEQDYVTQMDSLLRENKHLKNENFKIKTDFKNEQEKSSALTVEKEQLSKKVNLAAILKAYKISAIPVHTKGDGKKEKEVEKAKRADKIKVCFILSENYVAQSGNKTLYLRLARPDGKILCKTNDDENSFIANGERLQFSAKKDINYMNKAMDICVYYDNNQTLVKGKYNVTVFADGYQIGESTFELK